VVVEPFVLPHQEDFSSSDAFRFASGPANWNQQQGFYVYRAGRMIQSGGWSNLRAPDEHTKLARIAVSFPPVLDEAFKINVAKMRVQMPALIREQVREAIGPVVKLAREVYDRKAAKPTAATTSTHPNGSSSLDQRTSGRPYDATSHPAAAVIVSDDLYSDTAVTSSSPLHAPLLTAEEWSRRLLTAATDQERPVVRAVLERLCASAPEIEKTFSNAVKSVPQGKKDRYTEE